MSGVAIICLLVAVGIGLLVGWCGRKGERVVDGLVTTGICVALVLIVWFVVAVPISALNRNDCRAIAEGYGAPGYDWSIRRDCRIELPTGQLVPESKIRVTTEGNIIEGGS